MAAFTKNDPRINRRGRPRKGKSLSEILEKELRKKRDSGMTGKAELARMLVSLALDEKSLSAAKAIFDRLDGRPTTMIELVDDTELKLRRLFNGVDHNGE
jgi:hypothetical protein